MRYLAIILAATMATAWAGEAAMDKAKKDRLAEVTAKIAKDEACLKRNTPERIANERKNGGEGNARDYELAAKTAADRLPSLRLEFRWLKGELTAESAQKAVIAAEKSVSDAKDDAAKGRALATLDAARAELDAVRGFEAAELAKAGRGEF